MNAIADTKADMESHRIMDRLICGDVGYGKTEIAIRAAFKAVQEGKQVVYLVPTTILAQQHYNTFVQRMKDFPGQYCPDEPVSHIFGDQKDGKGSGKGNGGYRHWYPQSIIGGCEVQGSGASDHR